MKVVICDPKTGKAYSKTVENPAEFFDKKIGDTVKLSGIGLNDYEGIITGGSDSDVFPMRKDLSGTTRSKIFIQKNKKEGHRARVTHRGNTIAKDIAQLNLKITKQGKKLDELIVLEKKEEKKSAKEELVKASLETSGTIDAAKKMESEEFKKGKKRR